MQLAAVKAYRDVWVTPHEKDPFTVSMQEKLDLLQRVCNEIKKNQKVQSGNANINFRTEDKYFASSEGSSIQQLIIQIYGSAAATAVDRQAGTSATRNYTPTQASAGWEYVPEMNLEENAMRLREEVVEHLTAPAVKPGKKDLLLMPNHLMLTIHESVAHPTELDRALGYEANYAGTSYITPDKIGKRIASEHCTFIGDRTQARGLGTCGYDDDGVKTSEFTIIDKGIFRNYQTTREQAHLVGDKESHGCCQADSWATVPFQRMPNVWLKAGPKETTMEDLIAGIDDGVLDRRPRQLLHRSAALQLPVRRRRVLGNQGRQKARDDFARFLPGPHAGFLAGLRRHRRTRLLAPVRHHRRCERRADADQFDQPRLFAYALPQYRRHPY